MGNISKLKVFEYCNNDVIFNGNDLTLSIRPSRVNKADIIGDIGFNISTAQIDPLLNRLNPGVNKPGRTDRSHVDGNYEKQNRKRLHRLSLNISNTCNMACKYCYANKGRYYTTGMMMTKKTALNAVNFAIRKFSIIDHVNFFGGEPVLNLELIKLVCEYFIHLRKKGVINYLPQFGLTTNGYLLPNHLLELLKKYKLSLCISLDGPKEIHDAMRVNTHNGGTYDVIIKNVRTIIDMGMVPEFECTYTAEHLRNGIDIIDLMTFFYDELQCQVLHCPIVMLPPESPWHIPKNIAAKQYIKAMELSIFSLTTKFPKMISIAKRLLNCMNTQTPIFHYCPAGRTSMTINADGNIFSCFMLMHGSGTCLGNVNGLPHEFGSPDLINIQIQDADKWNNPNCKACWAQSLCFGCLGEDMVNIKKRITRSSITGQSAICDYKRRIIKAFLISIVKAGIDNG
ncbi:MAG: radical SAM protein [Pseudomonadota bacterium]